MNDSGDNDPGRQMSGPLENADANACSPPRRRVIYDGTRADLVRIAIPNTLLALATLGIYRFWGKTRLRRYLWSRVSFDGDRLEYSGRGRELFVGFLIALLILAPLVAVSLAAELLYPGDIQVLGVMQGAQYLIVLFLINVAIFRARRYRLSRTQWRGVRAGQSGSAVGYSLRAMAWLLVTGLTLGICFPLFSIALHRYRTENTWFGGQRMNFDGRARDLMMSWLGALLLWPFTLGLSYVWYRVGEWRYFVSRTRWGPLKFESGLRTGRVIGIYLLYFVSVLVMFGLLFGLVLSGFGDGLSNFDPQLAASNLKTPAGTELWGLAAMLFFLLALSVLHVLLVLHPMAAALFESLTVVGEEDFGSIAQGRQNIPGRGEGLADALDVGDF